MIETLQGGPDSYSRSELCRTLGVSRSGLYDHATKAQRPRCLQDKELAKEIKVLFSQSRCTYGARRLQQMLARKAMRCGRNRLVRLMRSLGLQTVRKRRFRPKTTQSSHDEPIAPNRLKQLPQLPATPNQVWCADLTYLPSQQDGWLYLAAELDLCSKRIAGWKLSSSLAAPLVQEAFERALKLGSGCPSLHHSDRGVQYASSSFRELLHSHHVTPSMSAKACCYDNAAMESFWATLKTECFHDQIPLNLNHAQAMLFDYIETFYNPTRLHSSLGYLSPIEFENSLYSSPYPSTV
jgi:putative transposase